MPPRAASCRPRAVVAVVDSAFTGIGIAFLTGVRPHPSEVTMDDNKKEGLISTAQDAVVDTAKAGWEGVKDAVATATTAVSEVLPGRTRRPSTTRRKAKSSAAAKKKTSSGRKTQRAKSASTSRRTGAAKKGGSTKRSRSTAAAKRKPARKTSRSGGSASSKPRRGGSRTNRSSR